MTVDPLVLTTELGRATERLLHDLAPLGASALAGPSRLPGWTRAHVLAHLVRDADTCVDLLVAARTGSEFGRHPGLTPCDAGRGSAGGPAPTVGLADVRAAGNRFADAAAAMPATAWMARIPSSRGGRPAAILVWERLREIELHHVDLDVGYATPDWPEAFSHRLLHELVAELGDQISGPTLVLHPNDAGHELTLGRSEDPLAVAGPAHELAGWLTGRVSGELLTVTPEGPLPVPPEMDIEVTPCPTPELSPPAARQTYVNSTGSPSPRCRSARWTTTPTCCAVATAASSC